MANVLLGIVGVILFIGLAMAGASFFGPVMDDAMLEGRANGLLQVLSTTGKAVSVRNRELETLTPVSADSSVLVPDYLEDLPRNPTNNSAIMLVNDTGLVSSGRARAVASKLAADQQLMCAYINRQGGGSNSVPTISSIPAQPMGCGRVNFTSGPYFSGDLVAYITIS